MLHKNHDEIKALCLEVKALSDYIGGLKRKANVIEDEIEEQLLREEIKYHQYQALFYIDKIENLAK